MDKKTKTWLWVGGALLLTGTAIALIVRANRKKKAKEAETKVIQLAETEKKTGTTTPVEKAPVIDVRFPIKEGSKGYGVKVLQQFMNSTCPASLKKAGVYPLVVDGAFGPKTESARKLCTSYNIDKRLVDSSVYDFMYSRLKAAKALPAA